MSAQETLATLAIAIEQLRQPTVDLANWWQTADPLATALVICLVLIIGSWYLSVVTGNYSQVDKLWSLAPIIYAWHFYFRTDTDVRALVIAVLITVWGLRLSYNFWRKGGYSGEEDYRWPIVRTWFSPFWFQVFNVFFIAIYQHLLLLSLVLPGYIATVSDEPFQALDQLAVACFIAFFALESKADQEQWVFQSKKYELRAKKERLTGDYKRGFLTTGLFAFSRHPNFFAEQMIWWSVYLFSVSATGSWFHWTFAGPFLLTLLFQGSTKLTEDITLKKYPEYAAYQQTTSRLVPWFPGRPLDA